MKLEIHDVTRAVESVPGGLRQRDETMVLGHETWGRGAVGVIVLHDWLGDSANYHGILPWLDGDRFRYAFADVRGYGRSRTLSGAYTSEEIANDVMRLADHLGWQQFHLVGHSMNGMAAFKTVLRDSTSGQRIRRLVAVTPVTPAGYPATNEDRVFLAAAIDDDATARLAFGALTANKLGSVWSHKKVARNRAEANPEAVRAYYDMWLAEDFSAEFEAAKITTPTLVIGGRQDLPGFQQAHLEGALRPGIGNVAFEYIENSGHYPMQETPALFAAMVERHLAGEG